MYLIYTISLTLKNIIYDNVLDLTWQ